MVDIQVFEHMMENGLYSYSCDPWYAEPGSSNYYSGRHLTGQVQYKGEIFVVGHSAARSGSGGMDEGSPESISIIRIQLEGE
jgi:hypothetical protein